MTILYVSHDVAAPSGGVRMLYRHVEALAAAGFDAAIIQPANQFRPWFSSSAPVLGVERLQALTPDDILVVPEDHHALLADLAGLPIRRYVFAQSFILMTGSHLSPPNPPLGLTGCLTISPIVADYARMIYGLEPVVVPNGIDTGLFVPRAKQPVIAYMPRRQGLDADIIRRGFLHHHPDLADIPWQAIDGQTEAVTSALLGQAAFFLSLSPTYEGFGLPPLEAMACGCLVVGFHGIGGRIYATPDNGLWIPDGDHLAAIDALAVGVRWWRDNDPAMTAMIGRGQETASQYGLDKQFQGVVTAWAKIANT